MIVDIAKLRLERGLTRKDLAQDLGVRVSVVADYEEGKKIPTYKRTIEILNSLDFDVILVDKRIKHHD